MMIGLMTTKTVPKDEVGDEEGSEFTVEDSEKIES